MADVNSKAPKKRKPNFSDREKIQLVEEYEKERTVLSAKFSPSITTKRKHEAWLRLAESMNSRNPSVCRTLMELQKKWQNLCSMMKDEFRMYRKEAAKTGGGSPPKEPSEISKKICDLLGEDDPTVHGIEGSIDSLQNDSCSSNPSTSSSSFCDMPVDAVSAIPPTVSALPSVSTSPPVESPVIERLPNPCPPQVEPALTASSTEKTIDDSEKTTSLLHRELIKLEKQRCLMEMEKIAMEKEKLSLEIDLLKQKRQLVMGVASESPAVEKDTSTYMNL